MGTIHETLTVSSCSDTPAARLHMTLENIFRSNENVFDRKRYQMRKGKNQRCANTLGWAEWPQRCPGPNVRNCEHMTLHDKRDSADGIKVRKTVLDFPSWPSLTTGALKVENHQPEEEIGEVKQKENKNIGRFKGKRTRPAAARAGHAGCTGRQEACRSKDQPPANSLQAGLQSYTHREVSEHVHRRVSREVLTATIWKACLQGWPIPKTHDKDGSLCLMFLK